MAWRTKLWLSVFQMTLLEWVFLRFPGRLSEISHSLHSSCNSTLNASWEAHWRPDSITHPGDVRMSHSELQNLTVYKDTWDNLTSDPPWLRATSFGSLASGNRYLGAPSSVEMLVFSPAWSTRDGWYSCEFTPACLSPHNSCLPFQVLLCEDEPNADSHRVQTPPAEWFLVPINLINSVLLRGIFKIRTFLMMQP